jgi:hypothetical protein
MAALRWACADGFTGLCAADRPVLFVFVCRTGEPRREVRELFTALRRGDVPTEIVLRPLGQDAVGSLVRALLGDEPPSRCCAR